MRSSFDQFGSKEPDWLWRPSAPPPYARGWLAAPARSRGSRDFALGLLRRRRTPRQFVYARSPDGGATFSPAILVNSQPGSAIAAGTIRGAELALGKAGRVHVAWNGSAQAEPKGPLNPDSGKPGAPMQYSRVNDTGDAFEPQRNMMHHSFGLDGGGSIAADRAGNVYLLGTGLENPRQRERAKRVRRAGRSGSRNRKTPFDPSVPRKKRGRRRAGHADAVA